MRLRMVATDLDGTVVRADQTMSPRTVAVLRACEDAGVRVVLVTGRPPRWTRHVLDEIGLGGTAVCANGALVLDGRTGRVSRARTLEHATVREVVRVLRGHWPSAHVALETTAGFAREPGYLTRWDTATEELAVAPLEELLHAAGWGPAEVVKVLLRVEGGDADRMLALAREAVGDRAAPTHSNAGDGLLEIGAAGVSKAATLAELAAEAGIAASEVVSFGDQPNDVPMLAWAGRGYAMADGHPEALAAATHRAPPVAQDGVAHVLEELLQEQVEQQLAGEAAP
jgi:Cof subfamily protein (haloacid dehalogenase superfamily)